MKTEHADLEDAIALARRAHAGQTDKAGKDYIEHPLRVMENCTSVQAKVAAVLHDVVEDSDTTLDDLQQQNFAPEAVEAVALLTKPTQSSTRTTSRRSRATQLRAKSKWPTCATTWI